MDDDIKPILAEIANQLRERNEMIRSQRAESEEMKAQWMGKMFGETSGSNPREGMMKRLEESRTSMVTLKADAQNDRLERKAFQDSLLGEIRRLNENLERLIADRS
jgi:hypothetical protein